MYDINGFNSDPTGPNSDPSGTKSNLSRSLIKFEFNRPKFDPYRPSPNQIGSRLDNVLSILTKVQSKSVPARSIWIQAL